MSPETSRVFGEQMRRMAEEIADLRAERDALRAELAGRSQVTSPIRLLNDLRRSLDSTTERLTRTER